ncbi:GNAT family N-acetyltransferase [Kribbella sp.]|uniref:GNAT family N-acetyltransferase n=1 Tax=Kribbella sp. TaxID=1871183 RepID=UPI002D37CFFC|nr:GNAT family N-acetyltransferase [Kribbella sp.]HZX01563.1 GNAT family N-acetyltransferase [Kribbella sp.]
MIDEVTDSQIRQALVRRAGADDAESLVRLRALMLSAMGTDVGGPDAPWRVRAREWFAGQLSSPDMFAAYVVEDPSAGVVAGAAGNVYAHPPGPRDASTVRGHLYNVSTHPDFRRRGLAKACVMALVDWFRDETAVGQIELHATDDGIDLYRGLGFIESTYPTLRFRTTTA